MLNKLKLLSGMSGMQKTVLSEADEKTSEERRKTIEDAEKSTRSSARLTPGQAEHQAEQRRQRGQHELFPHSAGARVGRFRRELRPEGLEEAPHASHPGQRLNEIAVDEDARAWMHCL